jgi:hypothetical protein
VKYIIALGFVQPAVGQYARHLHLRHEMPAPGVKIVSKNIA